MHTGKPTGAAFFHCIPWFQTQLILTMFQICYHSQCGIIIALDKFLEGMLGNSLGYHPICLIFFFMNHVPESTTSQLVKLMDPHTPGVLLC